MVDGETVVMTMMMVITMMRRMVDGEINVIQREYYVL